MHPLFCGSMDGTLEWASGKSALGGIHLTYSKQQHYTTPISVKLHLQIFLSVAFSSNFFSILSPHSHVAYDIGKRDMYFHFQSGYSICSLKYRGKRQTASSSRQPLDNAHKPKKETNIRVSSSLSFHSLLLIQYRFSYLAGLIRSGYIIPTDLQSTIASTTAAWRSYDAYI